ncbi:TIGR04211 family SH3 domain-containing protein [Motiliproteus sp. SC1-56]|uniref:TIGR04211 family SH3 domain-containing protein n=1 Tax=Motiliproteus sp. SC1-56 TaxID=2799565 RepID=UPI001A8BF6E2|nr:TIGR04211 family SH3 domain-containing protein [Motiliproteus sp. SC1-56]
MAQDYHVSDEVTVFMHTGPSNQYRIKARISSGTALQVLNRNNSTDYVQVRTDNGTEGWIEGRFVSEGPSIKNRLPRLESQLAQSREKVTEQAQALEQLQAQLEESTAASAESVAEVAQLENEVARLQLEIDRMDERNLMGWLIRGGGIALAGVVLGLIIPNLPKRRRRTDEWF